MALPYIENKGLRAGGIFLILVGIGAVAVILMMYKYSGTVVAQAKLTTPLQQVDMKEQLGFAVAEKTIRNAMVDSKLPSIDVDTAEWILVRFEPVHLTPEMGEIALILELTQQGIRAARKNADVPNGFGDRTFDLKDKATGEVVYSKEIKSTMMKSNTTGVKTGIDHTGKEVTLRTTLSSKSDLNAGRTTIKKEGDYVLEARIQKLRYAEPISDMAFIVKTGMMKEPSPELILPLVGMIIVGYFAVFLTIPLDKRGKKNKK